MGERWTTAQVAEWCNIQPSTYRDYVSEGRAPGPLAERDLKTGAKLYDADAVKAWHANRRGRGWRGQSGAELGQNSTRPHQNPTGAGAAVDAADQHEPTISSGDNRTHQNS